MLTGIFNLEQVHKPNKPQNKPIDEKKSLHEMARSYKEKKPLQF